LFLEKQKLKIKNSMFTIVSKIKLNCFDFYRTLVEKNNINNSNSCKFYKFDKCPRMLG
jgi:hypothetical protein